MTFSSRFWIRLSFCFMALFLAGLFASARAEVISPTSTQNYQPQTDQTVNDEGVLPEGMVWNRPVKAGTLKLLPKKKQVKEKAKTKTTSRLPIGALKPPTFAGQKQMAAPPQLAKQETSTSSVMLLQGMKKALHKAGHNTEVPASDIKATAEVHSQEKKVLQAPVLKAPTLEAASPDANTLKAAGMPEMELPEGTQALVIPKMAQQVQEEAKKLQEASVPTELKYEPGQEPKSLQLRKTVSAETPEAPEINISADGEVTIPSITSLSDAPPSLSEVVDGDVAVPSVTSVAETDTSIFGPAVEDQVVEEDDLDEESIFDDLFGGSDDVVSELKEETPVRIASADAACEPSITSWKRDCQAAGYPAYYVGEIKGETRIVCPGNEEKEVWLSNSCAAKLENEESPLQELSSEMSDEPSVSFDLPDEEPESLQDHIEKSKYLSEPEPVITSDPVDGSCGSANGLAASVRPQENLCIDGRSSSVTGTGPWRWTCDGLYGGMTVSCAAPVAPQVVIPSAEEKEAAENLTKIEDGKCGSAVDMGHETAPFENLCFQGEASRVNGGGPWTWACSGKNGGQAVACTAPKKTDGICGSNSGEGIDTRPTEGLCKEGLASAVTGEGPWNWTCSGLYGGTASTCQAVPRIDAVCGPASARGYKSAPKDGLCAAGKSSEVQGEGPWAWRCQGQYMGASVSCEAPIAQDGICGPANGSAYVSAPETGLCSEGRTSIVTGTGPWNWACAGLSGGETVSCTAAKGTKEAVDHYVACGAAAEALAFAKPSGNLCASGEASEVGGSGPWTWSCSDDAGHTTLCMTVSATEGSCGEAANVPSSYAPNLKLCESGLPNKVAADREHNAWTWKCEGSMGGASVSCNAPLLNEPATADVKVPAKDEDSKVTDLAICGAADGRGFSTAPDEEGLCAAGKASRIKGEGPWTWNCSAGKKKNQTVSCRAEKILDGVCGAVNGAILKVRPSTGLCMSGMATKIWGEGPWMWSCVGANGGNSVSCSALSQAQTKVDGTCGKATTKVFDERPIADLCESGSPSNVYGLGPWTWTCSGLNGGIASTCRAGKREPEASMKPGPRENGQCGPANGVAHLSTPEEGLCSGGKSTKVVGDGPWSWNCMGMNGGMSVSCIAPLMPPAPIVGLCGAASGTPTLTRPRGSLCSAGIASAVSGNGPWTWSCSGTNGGGAVSCVAPKAGKTDPRPLPSLTTPETPNLKSDVAPQPAAAPISLVTPALPDGANLPPIKPEVIPNRISSLNMPKVKPKPRFADMNFPDPVEIEAASTLAPMETPHLPPTIKPLNPPPQKKLVEAQEGLKLPITDDAGQPVAGARLVLNQATSMVPFTPGSDQLGREAIAILDRLASIMREYPNARVTLVAYSGLSINRSPREARRLSLNRALTMRDYLETKAIQSSRIDVKPMGANVASGDMDRVDIRVN